IIDLVITCAIYPIRILHLTYHHELIAVRSYGAVVVKAVGQLGITTDHVGRLRRNTGHGVVNTAALLGDLRPRQVNDTFLRVVHHGHPGRYTLAHHRTCRQGAVAVEHFDPVVIFDTQIFGVRFAHPDDWPPARQRQHQQVVAVGGVDTPLL